MPLPYSNLEWIKHGEVAEGTHVDNAPQIDIAPVNRPTYQLLVNDQWIEVELMNRAKLTGATFIGPVYLGRDPVGDLEAATRRFVEDYVAGVVGGSGVLKVAATITGDGTTTLFVVTHGLNTRDLSVTVRETSGVYEQVFPDVRFTDGSDPLNKINLYFSAPPGVGITYRVTMIG